MKINEHEVHDMTNLETSALLEAIRIIVEKSESVEDIKNALDRIQSVLKTPK